jgi:hypothetical protein
MQTINTGTVANDFTGDGLKTAMDKINDNFSNLSSINITEEIPLSAGQYYTLTTAILATPSNYRKKGKYITFEISSNVWRTYQFIGTDISVWENVDKFIDYVGDIKDRACTSYPYIKDFIQELYITGAKLADNLFIATFEINATTKGITIYIANSQGIVAKIYKNDGIDYFGKIIPIEQLNYSGIAGYAVILSGTVSLSGLNLSQTAINSKCFDLLNSPMINQYTIDLLRSDINTVTGVRIQTKYISDGAANSRITELYIPNAAAYGVLTVKNIEVAPNELTLFIYDSSNNLICLGAIRNGGESIFGKVIVLKKYNATDNFGYLIMNRTVNFDVSGVNYIIDNNIVSDITKSPQINSYLNATEQVVLIGDSLIGLNDNRNILESLLMDYTKSRVYNCGFGGCRMAWRNADGSDVYDKFSFVSIVDTLISKDYNPMISANTTLSGMYNNRIADIKDVDLSKPTTIICSFINNDITGNSPIGNLWSNGNTITDFQKNTFLGAMNYGVAKLLATYPHLKFIFLTEAWRYKTDKNGNSVPPYLFVNNNNNTSDDFRNAQFGNCLRVGIPLYDFTTLGDRNNFNINYMTIDGTHFSYAGYEVFAKMLFNAMHM